MGGVLFEELASRREPVGRVLGSGWARAGGGAGVEEGACEDRAGGWLRCFYCTALLHG